MTSGWCSGPLGCDSGRAHATCEDRIQRGLLTSCDCPRDGGHQGANPLISKGSERSDGVESETKRGPDRANESDPLATVSTRPKGA